MSSKIFKAIWIAAISVFLASLVFIMGISYNYFSSVQKKLLRNETELAAAGTALSGTGYLQSLTGGDCRITWIAGDGSVLFDNEADVKKMENHLEREEIRQALEEGFGEATRHSYTLADQQFYAAKRLPDGSVLRLSIVQLSVGALLLGFGQPISLVIFIALALSFVLASRLTRRIVKPINEIDIEHPEQYYGKESLREVEPLLRHISAQRLQLKRDQEEIERTALIRQEFTANVSHELKTPLHAISGYAELLESGLVREEDIRPFAGKIRDESLRLTRLVEDIIELTRLDSLESAPAREDCDLLRICENALDSLESAASVMQVSLLLKGESCPLKGSPKLLYSLIYNLCDNAVKYNHPGGNVTVSLVPETLKVQLSVSDTGIGIPERDQDRIFERFYRVDKSHSKEVGGTGLGLSIAKHAVLLHRGTIEVKSRPGEGSTFLVTLPVR